MSPTIFYAWESDLPGSTNRSFIKEALNYAVEQIRSDVTITEDPRLDHDTAGVPGSPDIQATIFEKIAKASVFVCDISTVTSDTDKRPCPNPNVLIELGYAVRSLGWENIVLVMNKAFGDHDDLPFDIRGKRTLVYTCSAEDVDKSAARKLLGKQLLEAVALSLSHSQKKHEVVKTNDVEALINSVEKRLPTQRSKAKQYIKHAIRELEIIELGTASDDDALIEALQKSLPVVLNFISVTAAVAEYDAEDAGEEIYRGFELILNKYHTPLGYNGPVRETDYDFFKFLGHELMVLLAANYIRNERWGSLNKLLSEPLSSRNIDPKGSTVSYIDVSVYVSLLDDVRQRKSINGSRRISPRADLLCERYTQSELCKLITLEEFVGADLFLHLHSVIQKEGSFEDGWYPWSIIYLSDIPAYVSRAKSFQGVQRLAAGLGLQGSSQINFGQKLKKAISELRSMYGHSTNWRPPVDRFDWTQIQDF